MIRNSCQIRCVWREGLHDKEQLPYNMLSAVYDICMILPAA